MPQYRAPLDDIRFVLNDVVGAGRLGELPGYEDVTPDVVDAVLQEAATMCEEVLAPLNQRGDAEGCRFEQGEVRTPPGFPEAYRAYTQAGWTGTTADPAWGGQGLPHTVGIVLDEMTCSANLSFGMYPGLTHSAYAALIAHGSDELRQRYLPKLVSGEWAATMCLTEAHAGSDLGIIRTRAEPAGDGAYAITGSKIFISAGEHDLTSNIIHLVLAKLPDAPPGTRGISLFIVPKFLPTEEGAPGTRNPVSCGSIEHKMGIKGSATCVLNFDGARGWLVGEEHKGMRAMFTMMNSARLGVGLQGLGLAEVSYQNALAYARERLQGRALRRPAADAAAGVGGAPAPAERGGDADPIIVHPDVRRQLLTMKAFVEGARALAYWVGVHIDVEERHPDPAVRQQAGDLVALMTPVVKAFLTDGGFEATSLGVQVLGGHGYIREYGMEQFLRDARIGPIYEGTNGIQALDLVGRKLPEGGGRLVKQFFGLVGTLAQEVAPDPVLAPLGASLGEALGTLQRATALVAKRGTDDPAEAGAAASDYLRMFGLVSLGYMWLRMARAANARAATAPDGARFADAKLKTARFYFAKVLPQIAAHAAVIATGAAPLMELEADAF